jgi:hypothetical protein
MSTEKENSTEETTSDILENVEKPLETPSGEPLKIEDDQSLQLVVPDKRDVIKEDPLIKALINEQDTFGLLDVVLTELAEESASLKYERIKKEFDNEPTDRISLRRANILKIINDSIIQKRNLALNDLVNLRSPQWQIVFQELMLKVRQTLGELGYSSEQMELFFDKLQNNLEGFEEITEHKLKENMKSQRF